jgi:DNA helicase-2/ATP-dependent DNA helicase PcrA
MHHDLRVNLSQQFQYILVDEFQDTNTIQSQLISLLSTQHGNLVVVGDDAQSIYSFRAAGIRNILDFPDRNEETKVFKLTHNYRSTPEILALANASIEHNSDQFDKSLTALQPSGKKPVIIGLPNPAMEAVYVADLVAQAIARGTHAHELAVLFRAAHHSQSLEFELMKRNIAYEYRGGMRFFERAHIKDIIAFARIFTNITDEMAWIRVLKIFPGIGMATAQKIAKQCMACESVSDLLMAGITAPGRAAGGWQACLVLLAKLDENTSRPSSFIRRLIGEKVYQEYVTATYDDARERLDDLEEFAYFSEQSKDLIEFLSIVSLTDDAAVNKETGVGKVILSTVHQAKGLEWDTVFILHACEGSFPHKRTYGDPIALEEERRLFYVAITRAKKTLTITYPESVGYEHVEYRAPSMFIEELPKECYDDRTRTFGDALQRSVPRRSFQASYDEEPIIVLDDMGEKKPQKPTPHVMQFLRDLDDL